MQILSLIFLLNSQKEEIVGQEHIFVRKLIVFELKKKPSYIWNQPIDLMPLGKKQISKLAIVLKSCTLVAAILQLIIMQVLH